jgi:hypothetical protein
VTEKYTGGGHGIREHILRMSNMAAKLKPMDADLELKPALLIHLVMASVPKEFDTFIVNYNMSPKKWDTEKTIAMCVQEEDRLKSSNGGSINYVKDNKKRNYNQSNQSYPSKPHEKVSFSIRISKGIFQWTKIHVSTVRILGTTRKTALIG